MRRIYTTRDGLAVEDVTAGEIKDGMGSPGPLNPWCGSCHGEGLGKETGLRLIEEIGCIWSCFSLSGL